VAEQGGPGALASVTEAGTDNAAQIADTAAGGCRTGGGARRSMSGEQIARALGLREAGLARWHGPCPCCGYPSGFAVTVRHNGLPLLYCNPAGCAQADLVAALRRRGFWPSQMGNDPDAPREAKERERSGKIALAADMWRDACPASGTLVETYLRSRGIVLPVPPVIRLLRMHSAYSSHPTGSRRPQMIARVEHCVDGPVAVHRSFLAIDGSSKASLDPVRTSHGPVGGAAVRLAATGSLLAVAEGVETALSYMQSTGIPTWAALSARGIRALVLPESVREVVIAADPDPVGIMAAQSAARRWINEGRRVSIARPPLGYDFNDLARAW